MVDPELLDAVDAAFAETARGLAPWPDPHADHRSPRQDEYSRLLDPGKWRILGARVDAWADALVAAGLADLDPAPIVRWPSGRYPDMADPWRLVPRRSGAQPLTVVRTSIDDTPAAGVVVGVGDPIVSVTFFPDCGCDACDAGSADELTRLDRLITSVVAGTFRHLTSRSGTITALDDREWSASGPVAQGASATTILADPTGWRELVGAPWSDESPGPG